MGEAPGGMPSRRRCYVPVDEAVSRSALDAAAEVCLCLGEDHGPMLLRAMTPG